MPDRDFDVVVLGATGVTGRRVAAYLDQRAPDIGARWAPAGRNPARVAEQLRQIGVTGPPETLVADVEDVASLSALAARARVVLNVVGPYTLYAEPVIEACVAAGTHYVDLTGEIGFVRDVIARHHDRARDAGVKVVQVCGFEALPPDLATLHAAELAHERGAQLLEVDVTVSVRAPRGVGMTDLLSGGTIQSMGAALGDPRSEEVIDPAVLVADPERAARVRAASPLRISPRVGPRGEAIAPMMPAPIINPPVIQRTFALLSEEGDEPVFAYREGIAIPGSRMTLAPRLAVAGTLSAVAAGFRALATAPSAVRRAAAAGIARAPGSGFGPNRRLDEWSWQLDLHAATSGGSDVEVHVEGDGHPGYLTTATTMGEVGLLLGEDAATPDRAGCLTPATALGTGAFERLAAAGLRFSP